MKRNSKKFLTIVLIACMVWSMALPAMAATPNRIPGSQFDKYYQNPQANQNSTLPGLTTSWRA